MYQVRMYRAAAAWAYYVVWASHHRAEIMGMGGAGCYVPDGERTTDTFI